MKGRLEEYRKKSGEAAVRIFFPQWHLPGGQVVHNVSIFPHECSTDVCEEGNHVHVDTYDSRPANRVLREEILISEHHEIAVSRMLAAQLELNMLTHELATHLKA